MGDEKGWDREVERAPESYLIGTGGEEGVVEGVQGYREEYYQVEEKVPAGEKWLQIQERARRTEGQGEEEGLHACTVGGKEWSLMLLPCMVSSQWRKLGGGGCWGGGDKCETALESVGEGYTRLTGSAKQRPEFG